MTTTIYATFPTAQEAEHAADALQQLGLSATDIQFFPVADSLSSLTTATVKGKASASTVTLPEPPPLPPLILDTGPRQLPPLDGTPEHYRYDALGAIIPDAPPLASAPVAPEETTSGLRIMLTEEVAEDDILQILHRYGVLEIESL